MPDSPPTTERGKLSVTELERYREWFRLEQIVHQRDLGNALNNGLTLIGHIDALSDALDEIYGLAADVVVEMADGLRDRGHRADQALSRILKLSDWSNA